MNQAIPPLIDNFSREVGESLPSLFIRLANNRYDPTPKWVINFSQKHLSQEDVVTCPVHAETYRVLAELTGLNSNELYRATPHRFSEILSPVASEPDTIVLPSGGNVTLLQPSIFSKSIWPEKAAQFCPRCLKEGRYHRLGWMLRPISACLEHKCILVQNCPGCNKKLSIQDVVNRYCDWCAFDLTNSPALSIEEDNFGLRSQRIIQSWFGIVGDEPDDRLPAHPPSVLYQVLAGLQRAIRSVRHRWDYMHDPFNTGTAISMFPCANKSQLTTLKSYLLYATAMKGLLNWPDGLYDFLTAYRLRDQREPADVASKDLGPIHTLRTDPDWQRPALQFLQQALGIYLQENHQYSVALKHLKRLSPYRKVPLPLEYVSEAIAARILHLPQLVVKRLVQLDYLADYQKANNRDLRRFNLVRHQDVLNLQEKWRGMIPMVDVSQILGVSEETALDLAMHGLIKAVQNFHTNNSLEVKIRNQSLTDFINRLRRGSVYFDYGQQVETINLIEATQYVSVDGDKLVALIECILAGTVRAYWPSDVNDLAHLKMSTEDLAKLT